MPATEAIRFYFGTSSHLLKRVVTADPPLDSMWVDKSINLDASMASITLADDVPQKKSPQEIARIAFSKEARTAANLVFRSLQIASATRQQLYPQMKFPFARPSTLTIAGVPITPSSGPKRFVIMRIDSCTGGYPFEDLQVFGGLKEDCVNATEMKWKTLVTHVTRRLTWRFMRLSRMWHERGGQKVSGRVIASRT